MSTAAGSERWDPLLLDSWAGAHARAEARETVQEGDRIWLEVRGAEALAWVGVALARGAVVLLASPDWTPAWQAGARRALVPTVEVQGDGVVMRRGGGDRVDPADLPPGGGGRVVLASGGTGGRLALVAHDTGSLGAAARGYLAAVGGPLKAIGVLPLWHVSGLMPVIRAAVGGGDWREADYRELGSGCGLDLEGATVSLVPTQLARLLEVPRAVDGLRRARLVLVGGAAAEQGLRQRAVAAGLPLALSYGMTETAAAVAIAGPGPEAVAAVPAATLLAGVGLQLSPLPTDRSVCSGGDGQICLDGPMVARARWTDAAGWAELPLLSAGCRRWLTGDRGRLDAAGRLQILGRLDNLINTGGEKVDPAVVLAVIQACGLVDDAWVAGTPDPDWGECVIAWVVPTAPDVTPARLADAVRPLLPPHARPKRWHLLASLPRTPTGKINRPALGN